LIIAARHRVNNLDVRLIFADISEIVGGQQVEAIKPVDDGFKGKFVTSHPQPLHQVAGSAEQNAPIIPTLKSPDSRKQFPDAAEM